MDPMSVAGPPDIGLEFGLGLAFPSAPLSPLAGLAGAAGGLAGAGELDAMGFQEVPDGGTGVVLEELESIAAGICIGIGGDPEPLGTGASPEADMVLGGGLAGELEAGIHEEPDAMGFQEVPDGGAGVVLEELESAFTAAGDGIGIGGDPEPVTSPEGRIHEEPDAMGFQELPDGGAGVVLEEPGSAFTPAGDCIGIGGDPVTSSSSQSGMVLGGGLAGELAAGIQLMLLLMLMLILMLVLWSETCAAGFAAPGMQPGTRSVSEAGPGPSVTATQPGRWGMGPMTFSDTGLGATHEFITSFGTKRFSFWNTGQSWIIPEPFVHVCTARESTSLSHPSKKSPCNA